MMNDDGLAFDVLASINPAFAGAVVLFTLAALSTGAAFIGWAIGEWSILRDLWRTRGRNG